MTKMQSKARGFWAGMTLAVAICLGWGTAQAAPNPAMAGISGGRCQGCHGDGIRRPAGHPDTNAMGLEDCRNCHGSPSKSLRGRLSLGHLHSLAEVGCADCHPDLASAQALDKNQCLSCHGPVQALAEATGNGPENPHNSIHYGMKIDCDLCHHIHEGSENYCNQCHEMTVTVP